MPKQNLSPFSFAELLVLLDVECVSTFAGPLPTVEEAAQLMGKPLDGPPPYLDTSGNLRFRSGLNHLWRAPRASLSVTPAYLILSITGFADSDIYRNMFGWVESYLGDTTTKAPKMRSGYRLMRGQGVLVELGYTAPRGDLSASDAQIDITVRRDESPRATLERILGVPELGAPSRWDLRYEVKRVDADVELHWASDLHDGRRSPAYTCDWWCSIWLGMLTGGSMNRDGASVYELREGTASKRLTRGNRRDEVSLRAPAAWLGY